ncbi:MAG: hypothetical protein K6D38_08630 [Pseudobutyrivibrio sp.]|nr:hypothetical protein [Pseudobutyrivibrio sp.]
MKHTNRFSVTRLGYAIGMALIFIIGNTLMCGLASVLIDKYICIFSINICFFLLFLLLIIRKRLTGKLPEFNYITYGKITLVVLIEWILVLLYVQFAPDFFAPFIVLPIVAGSVLDDSAANALSLYFVVLASVCGDYNIYMVLCYVTLISFGNILSHLLQSEEMLEKLFSLIIIFSVTVLTSIIFYYFNFLELTLMVFVYGVFCGVLACGISVVLVPILGRYVEVSQKETYEEFLSSDFDLYKEIRNFSFIEFTHASRVSDLSRKCALAIDCNASLAACSGFYYRLGKIVGEPMIDNAIKLANDYCFPNDVIQILSEYGGIVCLPSSKESAIVHMVDAVTTKVELFDADSMSSNWNQNMVIYQTINELSQKGFYDNSGLTMNNFLVIREILANEDILA